jgi:3-deoxy-D-manno-octulosonic-acid transferase
LKFDHSIQATESELTDEFRRRFSFGGEKPLIIAASTHEPEERWVIESLDGELGHSCRLMIAPRHPERFDNVARLLGEFGYSFVRRSSNPSVADAAAGIILLDSIGELRTAYPLADIVFVGGSLIRHGGQSVLEPAAAGKAILTGPYTHNFDAVVKEFLARDALIQTPEVPQDFQNPERLYEEFLDLLSDSNRRRALGDNARDMMSANRGATDKTIAQLQLLFK